MVEFSLFVVSLANNFIKASITKKNWSIFEDIDVCRTDSNYFHWTMILWSYQKSSSIFPKIGNNRPLKYETSQVLLVLSIWNRLIGSFLMISFLKLMSTLNILVILICLNRWIRFQGIDWILQEMLHRMYAWFLLWWLCTVKLHWWYYKSYHQFFIHKQEPGITITPPKNFWRKN